MKNCSSTSPAYSVKVLPQLWKKILDAMAETLQYRKLLHLRLRQPLAQSKTDLHLHITTSISTEPAQYCLGLRTAWMNAWFCSASFMRSSSA